jgi:hypothetical protein
MVNAMTGAQLGVGDGSVSTVYVSKPIALSWGSQIITKISVSMYNLIVLCSDGTIQGIGDYSYSLVSCYGQR